jgi:hypothetical protein
MRPVGSAHRSASRARRGRKQADLPVQLSLVHAEGGIDAVPDVQRAAGAAEGLGQVHGTSGLVT